MADIDLLKVMDLLKEANSKGLKISFNNEDLIVKIPKDREPDQLFLKDLKNNKDHLKEYFRNYNRQQEYEPDRLNRLKFQVEHNDKNYYEVTPFHVYWLDDKNNEFKEKFQAQIRYRIAGSFNINIFKKAFYYVINRHESLRSVFKKIDGRYFMTVVDSDSPIFTVNFLDKRSGYSSGDTDIDGLFHFEDHQFDIQNGPLILSRVIQTGQEEFRLSVKLHHVIYDAWSLDILVRDLVVAYASYTTGDLPDQAPLRSQYKEYMYSRNRFVEQNYASQKEYWQSLYPALPGPLMVPGAKSEQVLKLCRNGDKSTYAIPEECLIALSNLAGKYDTSMFTILQATFINYLYKLTGQNDIVIGTMLFGRDDLEGIEEQVGYYSYTDLMRFVLAEGVSLGQVIGKVRKSNEDMKTNSACTLMSFLLDMLPAGQSINTSDFWKINLTYSDMTGYYVDKSVLNDLQIPGLEIYQAPGPEALKVIDLDIKIEFVNFKGSMKMAVEYDCDLYEASAIDNLINNYIKSLSNCLC